MSAKAGVRTWDCIAAVEGEALSGRPRLGDFEAHVPTLRNPA